MLSSYLLALAVAGTVNAATPKAFEPASKQDLIVAFGTELATNGINIAKANTLNAPTIGTAEKLSGTYAVIMVDPDIPGAPTDSKTGQLLHWMQAGLQSSTTATTIAGKQVFELENPANLSAFATYRQPSPPNKALTTHRYTQLLVNTTGSTSALMALMGAAASRSNFSALAVVDSAGVKVVFGNYFNVTNEDVLAASGNATGGTASKTGAPATGTGSPALPSNVAVAFGGGRSGAVVLGVGAFAVAIAML